MRRVIKDDEWLRLTCQFLHYKQNDSESEKLCGLILGHYTSPWFFNFYLKNFDHFAAQLDGIKYLRFADNIFLVGKNKKKVHRALEDIRQYLRKNLSLELNGSTQVYRFEYVDRFGKIRGRAVNALGVVIHRNRVTLRKSILMRIRRKAIRISNQYIKSKINTRLLKSKVRIHSKLITPLCKERRRIINDGLEKSSKLASRKTG